MADNIASDGKPNFRIGASSKPVTLPVSGNENESRDGRPSPELMIPISIENNDNEDLDSLEAQLRESLRLVAEKKAAKERERLEKERIEKESRPLTLLVKSFSGAMVLVSGGWREDVLEIWKSVPGRMFRGNQENAIPVGKWSETLEKLRKLENVTITFAEGVEEQIDFHLNQPIWFVELEKRNIKLTPGPRANTYDVNQIPGIEWQAAKYPTGHKWFHLPLSEAWNLFSKLEKIEGVLWTDEAKQFTIAQVEARQKLDEIALATEMPYDAGFLGGYKLRPFQGVGCNFIEATGGKALLAYEMGLGKTPMSLAYAWKNKFRTVIICPASLKSNWVRQIKKFTGENANVFIGGEPTKHDLVEMLTSPSIFSVINYDIIGRKLEYNEVKQDKEGYDHEEHKVRYLWVDAINMSKPDLIIFDESHYIKNTDSNRSIASRKLDCPRILHMTGTPVLNRPGELWPLLTMLAPETFPAEETFIKQYTIDGKRAKNVEQLREALKPIMIRRKHSDVRKDMPPLNRITEYHELGEKARKLYKKVLQGIYEKIAAYDARGRGGDEVSVTNILAQIQRLKQICAIDKIDRTTELATELHYSASEERHNKVLIFSQYKGPAFAISQRLGHEALSFISRGANDFITADNIERDRLVQQFQNDPSIKYLVVTEKTAREGHDITEAGFVIFNDLFWTPANHEQGEGRAYMRENDPHGISSYYLITDSQGGFNIEEDIWELLTLKTDIINQTVEGVEGSRDVSIATALIQKMRDSMWNRQR